MSTAYVYRVFDADDRLLYVGRAIDLRGFKYRLRYHRDNAPWWPFHSYLTAEPFPTFDAAYVGELEAIRAELPRWNVADRNPAHPDGPITKGTGIRRAPWLTTEIWAWRTWLAGERVDRAARRSA